VCHFSGSKFVPNSNLPPVLLRDIDVRTNSYPLGNLIEHCMELMDIDYSNSEMGNKILCQRLGIEEIHDREQQKLALRATVKQMYIEGRSLALNGLRNGLNLGGEYLMPGQSNVSRISDRYMSSSNTLLLNQEL
jgi:hypothetical protein